MSLSIVVLTAVPSPNPAAGSDVALERAVEGAEDLDLDQAIVVLEAAIADARLQPEELHARVRPSYELLDAYVLLARLQLASGDEAAASATLDTLIVLDIARRAPVHGYGPELTGLYEARHVAAQRAGMASLELECGASSGCAFVLDGSRAEHGETGIHIGDHELWVSTTTGTAGERQWTRVLFDVTSKAEALVYRAPVGWVESEPVPDPTLASTPPAPPARVELGADSSRPIDIVARRTRGRVLPRPLAISGIVAGTGAVLAGALALGLHGRCVDGLSSVTETTTRFDCPRTYKAPLPVAGALVAAGAALLLPSSIILGLDEVRVRRGQRSAVVRLGFAF